MMKKTLLILCCLLAALATQAQDKKIAIASAYASSSQYGYEAKYAIDGKKNTYWINSDNIWSFLAFCSRIFFNSYLIPETIRR